MSAIRFVTITSTSIALCVPQPLHADVAADLRLSFADDCARQVQRLDDGIPLDSSAWSECSLAFGDDPSPENMFNLGMVLHAMELYEGALDMFEGAARQDSADAQNMVGIMHLNGQAVPENDAEAARWFLKAAEQNLPIAQNNLGLMYAWGTGVSQDDAEAARWFARAAEQGLADGQSNLGLMYEFGRGLRQDYARAVSLYRQAAESGHAVAQNSLGRLYGEGLGVPRNDAEAVRWFARAAEQGLADGQSNLGLMYEFGRGLRQDYARAVSLYRQAAENGNAEAQNSLGLMYSKGQGVPTSGAEARRWWTKAAEQGHAVAQINLGDSYLNEDKNFETAARWYEAAAEQGHPRAQAVLGYLYAIGRGVPRDKAKAGRLLEQAERNGTDEIASAARDARRRLAESDGTGDALAASLVALGAIILGTAIFADDAAPEAEDGSSEWRRWCWTDFLDPHPTDKPTWCREPSGAERIMPYVHPCYGVEGWCYW